MMGLTDFSANQTRCSLHLNWDFGTLNGTFGVIVPISIGVSPLKTVINRMGWTVFYMKTWLCPESTYFDPNLNYCTNCQIRGCLECEHYNKCIQCDIFAQYQLVNDKCSRCDMNNDFYTKQ
jgi:hypothetical protein